MHVYREYCNCYISCIRMKSALRERERERESFLRIRKYITVSKKKTIKKCPFYYTPYNPFLFIISVYIQVAHGDLKIFLKKRTYKTKPKAGLRIEFFLYTGILLCECLAVHCRVVTESATSWLD